MSLHDSDGGNEKKRKRLTQACELCRKKKVKCDGEKPSCGNCTRLDQTCTYTSSNKKRGPRQGYIEMLEQRLSKMEQILLVEANESSNQNAEDRPQTNTQPEKSPPSNKLPETHMSFNYPKENKKEIHNPPPIMTHISHQQPPSLSDTYPPMHLVEHILDIFFKCLFISVPIFDEAILRREIQERKCSVFLVYCLMAACARYSDHPEIKKIPAWFAGEVYADKARSMVVKIIDEPTIPHLQGMQLLTLHEYGCGRGPRSWMYGGIAIRMSMELGLYEESDINGNETQTSEKLMQLEIRRGIFWSIYSMDKISSAATGRPSVLSKKCCTTFLPARVDRYNMSQYYTENLDGSRYVFLNVNELKESQLLGSSISSNIPPFSQKPYLDCYAYFIRSVGLLDDITTFINLNGKKKISNFDMFYSESEFHQLDQAIECLEDKLPPYLKNTAMNLEKYRSSEKIKLFILLHITLSTVRVILHRPSIALIDNLTDNQTIQPELKKSIQASVQKCMDAVDNVTVLLKEIGNNRELMHPFLTYLTYTVATVVVTTSFSSRVEQASKARAALGIYFQLLLSARNLWAMADKLYFMVRDLYAIHTSVLGQQNQQIKKVIPVESTPYNNQQESSSKTYLDSLIEQPKIQTFQNSESPTNMINNALLDWTQSYYNAAMLDEAPTINTSNNIDFLSMNNNNTNNNFQALDGLDLLSLLSANMNNNDNNKDTNF